LPSLRPGARVIATSSVAYKWAAWSEEALVYATQKPDQNQYGTGLKAYAESKLALIIWARNCAAKYETIKFNTVHPGVCNTNLFGEWLWPSVINFFNQIGVIKSAAAGAKTILHVAQTESVKSGALYADGREVELGLSARREELFNKQILCLLQTIRAKYTSSKF